MFFSGSVIESTVLPITLILSNANYQMWLVIVVDSISFQLPITELPISGVDAARGRGRERAHAELAHAVDEVEGARDGRDAVGPVGGAEHAALELVVLVVGVEDKVAGYEVHVEVFVAQNDAEGVAFHWFIDR